MRPDVGVRVGASLGLNQERTHMDDFRAVLAEAVEAATLGDLEALLIARMLLGYLEGQLRGA